MNEVRAGKLLVKTEGKVNDMYTIGTVSIRKAKMYIYLICMKIPIVLYHIFFNIYC